jgi:hypothetical protein
MTRSLATLETVKDEQQHPEKRKETAGHRDHHPFGALKTCDACATRALIEQDKRPCNAKDPADAEPQV